MRTSEVSIFVSLVKLWKSQVKMWLIWPCKFGPFGLAKSVPKRTWESSSPYILRLCKWKIYQKHWKKCKLWMWTRTCRVSVNVVDTSKHPLGDLSCTITSLATVWRSLFYKFILNKTSHYNPDLLLDWNTWKNTFFASEKQTKKHQAVAFHLFSPHQVPTSTTSVLGAAGSTGSTAGGTRAGGSCRLWRFRNPKRHTFCTTDVEKNEPNSL